MAKKHSTHKSSRFSDTPQISKNAKSFLFSVEDFVLYIDDLSDAISGLTYLVKEINQTSSRVAIYPLDASRNALADITNDLCDRFEKQFGDVPNRLQMENEIEFSDEDRNRFVDAIEPFCTFVEYMTSGTIEDDVPHFVGLAGAMAKKRADEAIGFFKLKLGDSSGTR